MGYILNMLLGVSIFLMYRLTKLYRTFHSWKHAPHVFFRNELGAVILNMRSENQVFPVNTGGSMIVLCFDVHDGWKMSMVFCSVPQLTEFGKALHQDTVRVKI